MSLCVRSTHAPSSSWSPCGQGVHLAGPAAGGAHPQSSVRRPALRSKVWHVSGLHTEFGAELSPSTYQHSLPVHTELSSGEWWHAGSVWVCSTSRVECLSQNRGQLCVSVDQRCPVLWEVVFQVAFWKMAFRACQKRIPLYLRGVWKSKI